MTHHPAAFINAIAEEGTKAEAIEWLQKTWNELCDLRKGIDPDLETLRQQNKQLRKTLREVQQAVSTLTAWVPHSDI